MGNEILEFNEKEASENVSTIFNKNHKKKLSQHEKNVKLESNIFYWGRS